MEGVRESPWLGGAIVDLPVEAIGTRYSSLRLVSPRAEASMERSLKVYGQISPLVVGHSDEKEHFELVDGFKRFRVLTELGFTTVKARILEIGARASKAAIIHLNRNGSICELEEGLVLHSLSSDDGLKQCEIAVLFGRHKSWVSRRISLVTRLCGEVQDHLRLGLVSVGVGRELARLPRGNQRAALRSVLKHRLICRETGALVGLLMNTPAWNHEAILRFPEPILEARTPPGPGRRKEEAPSASSRLRHALGIIDQGCASVASIFEETRFLCIEQQDRVLNTLEGIHRHISRILAMMEETAHDAADHTES